ncbi:hypothetical protein [Sinobaca sp. H24]|nr:hypothetical protein [Sinobaca sp. H24]
MEQRPGGDSGRTAIGEDKEVFFSLAEAWPAESFRLALFLFFYQSTM